MATRGELKAKQNAQMRAELNRQPGETLRQAQQRLGSDGRPKTTGAPKSGPAVESGKQMTRAGGSGGGQPPATRTQTSSPAPKGASTSKGLARSGPTLKATSENLARVGKGLGRTGASRAAGALGGPIATAGLVGSGLVDAAQKTGLAYQERNKDKPRAKTRGQRAGKGAAGAPAKSGVAMGGAGGDVPKVDTPQPKKHGGPTRSQAAEQTSARTPKPAPKAAPKAAPKTKPKSDMAAWAKKEQEKLKADQQKRRNSKVAESNPKAKSRSTPVGKKTTPKKRSLPKGNADKSRNLWLGN